ncbi:hypothetical protein HYX12_01275 [Candidatus Woesearchaeota archaeon]|nr:hypothetical protein [Candidatus Woesearchaeota archaeon]
MTEQWDLSKGTNMEERTLTVLTYNWSGGEPTPMTYIFGGETKLIPSLKKSMIAPDPAESYSAFMDRVYQDSLKRGLSKDEAVSQMQVH